MIAYCDGGCWPNPGGLATWGWMIEDGGSYVAHDSGAIAPHPANSNNTAEYEAIIRVLTHIVTNDLPVEEVRTDSNLIANQVLGKWRCKTDHLIPLLDFAQQLYARTNACVVWVPREENESADQLTNEARTAWEEAHQVAM